MVPIGEPMRKSRHLIELAKCGAGTPGIGHVDIARPVPPPDAPFRFPADILCLYPLQVRAVLQCRQRACRTSPGSPPADDCARGDLKTARDRVSHYRIDLGLKQHKVAHDHGVAVPGLERAPAAQRQGLVEARTNFQPADSVCGRMNSSLTLGNMVRSPSPAGLCI